MKFAYSQAHPWNYSLLKARTAELGKTNKAVAFAGKMTPSTYSLKLNGKGDFSQQQINNICAFLNIDVCDIPKYFFTPKV